MLVTPCNCQRRVLARPLLLTGHMAFGAINQMKAWQGLQAGICKPEASSVLMTKERCRRDWHPLPQPPARLISRTENKGDGS